MAETTKSMVPWLNGSRPPRVAVVGDVILDEYLDGQVNRISPEAPVPIHLVTRSFHVVGGAANAARNVKLAGGEVYLLSVAGNDEAGRILKELLVKDKIDTSHIVTASDRPTIRKTRVTASSHQLVRIDWERVHPIDQSAQNQILERLNALEFDALLISDYGKGTLPSSMLSQLIELAVSRGVPAVVDPKGRDYSKYLHAALITPNRKEACDALGLDPASEYAGEELGRRLQKTFGLKNVLVTLGAKGMVLVPEGDGTEGKDVTLLPAMAREVYDVSGAGDTVVALMALSMACNTPLNDAMHIANTGAAIVVEKWGTQPIQLAELEASLRETPDTLHRAVYSTQAKVISRETLRHIVKEPSARHKKVVFTNGCFDIMHAGHVSYLEEARSRGDLLVVGINSDESVRGLKGPQRPIIPLEQRMRMLAALSCVDYVVPFSEETPYELIAILVPDVLVKGADWNKDEIVGGDIVKAAGGVVDTINFVAGLSTTEIVKRIRLS